ncbi:MAG: hypothetical protein AAGI22_02780 [Planctomycetota bacterium]
MDAADEPPKLFRPRPGDEIVEPLFGALRSTEEPPPDDVPRTGWRGILWWRLRLLFGRRRKR